MHRWFRRKTFGYGWTPCSWEGWVATSVFTAGVIAIASHAREIGPVDTIVLLAALTASLLAITSATSEKDR